MTGSLRSRRNPSVSRILVADDSPDNRLLIAAYLRNEPYQVDFAEDGKEAVEKFTANRYDMVFMDVQMPEMDGLTATRDDSAMGKGSRPQSDTDHRA